MSNTHTSAERLVKNSAWLFGAEATAKIIGLATQIIAARYLGDKGYGNFSLAFALSGIFIVFLDMGLSIYVGKQVSRHPEKANQYLKSVFHLKKYLALPVVGVLACLVWFMSGESNIQIVVCAIGLALVLNGFTEMYLAVFRAFEWMSLVCILLIIQRTLFFALGYISLLMGYQVVPFSILFLVVSILSLLLARWNMKRRSAVGEVLIDWQLSKTILRDSLPACGIFLFSYVYFRIDAVFVYFLLGEAETGWYNAAFKWVEVLALLVASIRSALFPALSRTYHVGDDQFKRIGKEAVRYLLMIGLPLTVGTYVLAPQLVGLLYGDLYEATIQILQIMALVFFLIYLNEFMVYFLLSADRFGEVLKVVVGGSVLNIALNFWTIPKWGVNGAAAAAGITELLLFFMLYNCMSRFSGSIPFLKLIWKPTFSALAMGIVLDKISWPLFPSIFVGGVVYLVLLLLLRAFNDYDFQVVKNIFNRTDENNMSSAIQLPEASLPLSIIIVSYKSLQHIEGCLNSIQSNLSHSEYEIIVVDNASNDGTVESLRASYPHVRLIQNDQNLGFSKANNQGIKISQGKYILLLNNDTEVLPGSLESMMKIMKESPHTGLLGCRLVNPDLSVQESFGNGAGFVQELFRKFVLNKFYASHPKFEFFLNWIHSEEKEVGWIRGACMLFQREALVDVGLMDENFFMYFEDMDIGLCLRKRGWEVRFTPSASIIHHQGVSHSKAPYRSAMEYRKSQLYYYRKNFGEIGLKGLKVYLLFKFLINTSVNFIFRHQDEEELVRFRKEERELIRSYQ